MSLWEGMILRNRYRVIRALGEGGFGAAYLVEDSDMKRQYVVKASMRYDAAHRNQFDTGST